MDRRAHMLLLGKHRLPIMSGASQLPKRDHTVKKLRDNLISLLC